MTPRGTNQDAIGVVVKAANDLGIELDIEEAQAWIAAVSAETSGEAPVVNVDTGVYGHRLPMADHSTADLARFRHVARLVGFDDRPPDVVTALALSGAAARSRIHQFPTDFDFFERVHLRAPSRREACELLADVIREKALSTLTGPGYRLQEIKFGTWAVDGSSGGVAFRAGSPIGWTAVEVQSGAIEYKTAEGTSAPLTWSQAALDPGWCKLDWVVADPDHGGVSNASTVLDATWEAPDGTITPLDGFLDPYFQEVYIDVDSIPLFSKLVKEMGADSVAEYVERLTDEVYKYTVTGSNYGKAARRMYNIFRLTGQYAEAAYIRELFDEPATALYQVASLLRSLHKTAEQHDNFDTDSIVAQVDQLIMSAVAAFDGGTEAEVVDRLLRLREAITRQVRSHDPTDDVVAAQQETMTAVDEYFKRALMANPSIKDYLVTLAKSRTT